MRGADGYFSPTRTLSRGEALVMIMRGVDGGKKDETLTPWYKTYLDRARQLGIFSVTTFDGSASITRGKLIEWIYAATEYLASKNSVNPLVGLWNLYEFNNIKITDASYTLTLDAKTLSAKLCNTMF